MQGVADPPPASCTRRGSSRPGQAPVAAGVTPTGEATLPLASGVAAARSRSPWSGSERRIGADQSRRSWPWSSRDARPRRPLPELADLEALYDAHHRQAIGLAYRLLGDLGDAEEVVQEVFLSAWRSGHTYDPSRGSTHTWVLAMVRNRYDRRAARAQAATRPAAGRRPGPARHERRAGAGGLERRRRRRRALRSRRCRPSRSK